MFKRRARRGSRCRLSKLRRNRLTPRPSGRLRRRLTQALGCRGKFLIKSEIEEIRIDITAGEESALSMQLCRDGTVGRRGSGQVPAIPTVVLGMCDVNWFLQLVEGLDDRVLSRPGVYDLPDKKGLVVTYTVVFLGGKVSERSVLAGFRFIAGSESGANGSLLPYFDNFVGKAVQLTEQWYQGNLAKQHGTAT